MMLLRALLFPSTVLGIAILPKREGVQTTILPLPEDFKADNGTKWNLIKIGSIHSSTISLAWNTGRTSTLSNTTFWNFGVVEGLSGFSFTTGFSTGPAFYASPKDNLVVDLENITNVYGYDFIPPSPLDEQPDAQGPTPFWSMETSNVVELSPGVGVCFSWATWASSNGTSEDRGLAVSTVKLGDPVPLATRTGALWTGPDALQMGVLAILKAEDYLYAYSNTDHDVVISRAPLSSAFDITTYEHLRSDGRTWTKGIPAAFDSSYGFTGIYSDGPGSIMFSDYFNKYLLFVGAYGIGVNFYASDTPYGPWSEQYKILDGVPGFGISVHPQMSPNGDQKELWFSSGVDGVITMWKIEFGY